MSRYLIFVLLILCASCSTTKNIIIVVEPERQLDNYKRKEVINPHKNSILYKRIEEVADSVFLNLNKKNYDRD